MEIGEDSDRQTSDGQTDGRTDGHTGVQLHMHSTGTAARGSMPGSSARGLLTRGRACEAAGLEPAASAVEGRHVECDADEDGADERGAGENGAGERDADERGADERAADERGAGERDADERDGHAGGRCPATAARQCQRSQARVGSSTHGAHPGALCTLGEWQAVAPEGVDVSARPRRRKVRLWLCHPARRAGQIRCCSSGRYARDAAGLCAQSAARSIDGARTYRGREAAAVALQVGECTARWHVGASGDVCASMTCPATTAHSISARGGAWAARWRARGGACKPSARRAARRRAAAHLNVLPRQDGLVWTCMDLPYRDYMGSTRSHSGREHPRTCPGVLFPIIVPVHSHLGPICANWTFGVPAR